MPDNDIHFDKHWPSYILYTRNSQNDKKIGMRMHKISNRKQLGNGQTCNMRKNVILQFKQADKCNIRDSYLLKG